MRVQTVQLSSYCLLRRNTFTWSSIFNPSVDERKVDLLYATLLLFFHFYKYLQSQIAINLNESTKCILRLTRFRPQNVHQVRLGLICRHCDKGFLFLRIAHFLAWYDKNVRNWLGVLTCKLINQSLIKQNKTKQRTKIHKRTHSDVSSLGDLGVSMTLVLGTGAVSRSSSGSYVFEIHTVSSCGLLCVLFLWYLKSPNNPKLDAAMTGDEC